MLETSSLTTGEQLSVRVLALASTGTAQELQATVSELIALPEGSIGELMHTADSLAGSSCFDESILLVTAAIGRCSSRPKPLKHLQSRRREIESMRDLSMEGHLFEAVHGPLEREGFPKALLAPAYD